MTFYGVCLHLTIKSKSFNPSIHRQWAVIKRYIKRLLIDISFTAWCTYHFKMGVFFVDVHSKTVFSSFIGCILIRLYWLEDMMHKNPFKDVCFLYQYVSKLELNNQGVALHLFRASKYIGKIRLSNSIQTFCINMNSVIVMSCSTKYYYSRKMA